MLTRIDGATRVSVIIGTPIRQVRSPEGITRCFQSRGIDAVLVPFEVAPSHVADLIAALAHVASLDGIVVTVPHKQAAFLACRHTTARAKTLQAVNVMRRLPEGGFVGDHLDGESLMTAFATKSVSAAGRSALLIGAGGAGSAIALSLLDAGVTRLVVHDLDHARSMDLVGRLAVVHPGRIAAGAPASADFDLIVNASPVGMRAGDSAPIDTSRLAPATIVADCVTPPGLSALVAAARAKGLVTVTGQEVFDAGADLLADYLLAGTA